ncbi:D-hydantoinase [compost metagenome]
MLGGRISLNRFVELTATQPARAYGLYPKKGTLAIGSDADLVIWEERDFTLDNGHLHHAVDYTPYAGMTLRAWPAMTLLRGQIVWDGTHFAGAPGQGQFLPRGLPSLAPPSARRGAQPAWR